MPPAPPQPPPLTPPQAERPLRGAAAPPPQPPLRTTRIHAAGICCPMEVPLVRRVLGGMPGVQAVDVSVVAQTVLVKHDASAAPPGALVAALNGVALEASLAPPRAQAQARV